MADSEVDTTQQVTSQTPATKPKNPNRVKAGKLTAEKTKKAREEQKKKLAEYEAMNAPPAVAAPAVAAPAVAAPAVAAPAVAAPAVAAPAAAEPPANVSAEITTTQWLSAIGIIVSLVGLYYKREEVQGLLTPKAKTPPTLPPSPVAPKRGKIIEMD